MSKSFSASDMLSSSRRGPRQSDTIMSKHVDQSSSRVVDQPEESTATTARATYMKMAVSLAPEQRSWLKATPQRLDIEGLSSSDLVRLAVNRLREEVDAGLPLADLLIEQAYEEADRLTGRRNRGLPRRTAQLDE